MSFLGHSQMLSGFKIYALVFYAAAAAATASATTVIISVFVWGGMCTIYKHCAKDSLY